MSSAARVLFSAVALVALVALCGPANAASESRYEYKSLHVPVLDGTWLAMNVYRPADSDGVEDDPLPVLSAFLLAYPVVQLALSSDHPDDEVFAYLEEADPKGKGDMLSFGSLMISHREGSVAPWDTLGLPGIRASRRSPRRFPSVGRHRLASQ